MRCIGIYAYSKSYNDTVGGVEAQVTHLAQELAKRGYRVIIHCLANDDVGLSYTEAGFTFQSSSTAHNNNITVVKTTHGGPLQSAVAENTRISEEYGEEIIFCFGTRDGYVFDQAIQTSKSLTIPLVSFIYFTVEERWYRSHFVSRTRTIPGLATEDEKQKFFDDGEETVRRVVRDSTLVIVPTHYVRGQVLTLTGISATEKIKICYHGVSEDLFSHDITKWDATRETLNIARLNIPFACDKGFLWALDFFAKNHQKLPSPRLVFCGSGNGQKIISDHITAHKLQNQVEMAGFVNQKELSQKYRQASYLLVPSMMEAGCTVVVEAVISGCLPLALDMAGLAEVMELMGLDDFVIPLEEYTLAPGLQVMVPQTQATVDLYQYCANHQEEVTEKLKAAQKAGREKFSLNSTTSKLLAILNQAGLLH